jgi:hypothetical protein
MPVIQIKRLCYASPVGRVVGEEMFMRTARIVQGFETRRNGSRMEHNRKREALAKENTEERTTWLVYIFPGIFSQCAWTCGRGTVFMLDNWGFYSSN